MVGIVWMSLVDSFIPFSNHHTAPIALTTSRKQQPRWQNVGCDWTSCGSLWRDSCTNTGWYLLYRHYTRYQTYCCVYRHYHRICDRIKSTHHHRHHHQRNGKQIGWWCSSIPAQIGPCSLSLLTQRSALAQWSTGMARGRCRLACAGTCQLPLPSHWYFHSFHSLQIPLTVILLPRSTFSCEWLTHPLMNVPTTCPIPATYFVPPKAMLLGTSEWLTLTYPLTNLPITYYLYLLPATFIVPPKAMLLGTSEAIPVSDGQLKLGTWQSVIMVELDGPRTRTVGIQVTGVR